MTAAEPCAALVAWPAMLIAAPVTGVGFRVQAKLALPIQRKGCPAVHAQVVREGKLAQQQADQEDRIQRNLDRAAAPAYHKKKSKPAMGRSIIVKKALSTKVVKESADAELDKYLTRDFSRV